MENMSKPTHDIMSGQHQMGRKSKDEKMSFIPVGTAFSRKEGKEGYFLKFHLQNPNGEYYLLPIKNQK